MPRKELMSWNAREQRWHKRYRGKSYAVSPRKLHCDCSKSASLAAANKWWEQKQADIDGELFANSDHGRALNAAVACAKQSLRHEQQLKNGDRYALWQPITRALQVRSENKEPLSGNIAIDNDGALSLIDLPKLPPLPPAQLRLFIDEIYRAALARASGAAPLEPWNKRPNNAVTSPTIRDAIAEFVDKEKRSKVCPERVVSVKSDLDRMATVLCSADPERVTTTIDEQSIREIQEPQTWSAKWAAKTYQRYYSAVSEFVRWCYEQRYLSELPRNLGRLKVETLSPGKQPTFAPAELKAIFAKLDDLAAAYDADWSNRVAENATRFPSQRREMKPRRNGAKFLKLSILLMLNTGSTQQDLSDLLQCEVDWTEGRLTRKRSKNKKHETAPVVCYKLWPECFRLLQEFRSTDPALVFVNEDGRPLKTTREEFGKLKKSDSLKCLLFRFQNAISWTKGKGFKTLRKTGATLLKAHGIASEFREMYLGHSQKSIREIHYEQDSPEFQARFDAAIAKLGELFGL